MMMASDPLAFSCDDKSTADYESHVRKDVEPEGWLCTNANLICRQSRISHRP